ncbi:MAG TPA: YciI family protein [Micromonosporaceae bacterium]|jgi:hypothetical protein
MRYMLTSLADSAEPDDALFVEMGKFIQEMSAAGILLSTGGLEPGGRRIVSEGGEITVLDGPFAESKEAVVGFALVEVDSLEQVVELGRRFRRIVGDGTSVIQQVFGP